MLDEQKAPLKTLLDLKVGDTLMLNVGPDSLVQLRAGSVVLTHGRMGRRNHNIAVRVEQPLAPSAQRSLREFE